MRHDTAVIVAACAGAQAEIVHYAATNIPRFTRRAQNARAVHSHLICCTFDAQRVPPI